MLKNILKIMSVLMMLFVLTACNLMPEPEKSYDTVEFMYRRVKPIVNPEWYDPDRFSIYRNNGGGMNLHLTKTGDNEWRAEGVLDYTSSGNPYQIWVNDGKANEYTKDIYVRIKGEQEWKKLTLFKPNGLIPDHEWAVFCLDKNGIYFPE